jgi:hypothetical protein
LKPWGEWQYSNVKNSMPTDRYASFSGDKTPVVLTMEPVKRKPSDPLGLIIKILMILKLVTAILHLLK